MRLKFVHIFWLTTKLVESDPPEQPSRWTPINNSYEYFSTYSYVYAPAGQHTALMHYYYQVPDIYYNIFTLKVLLFYTEIFSFFLIFYRQNSEKKIIGVKKYDPELCSNLPTVLIKHACDLFLFNKQRFHWAKCRAKQTMFASTLVEKNNKTK